MAPPVSRRHAMIATVLAVAVIVHGSLWPYDFRIPPGPAGPIDAFLNSWVEHPSSRGDILGNVLFYMPLGLLAALTTRRLLPVVAAGASLSTTMELLQFYDPGRVSSVWDVASNTAGTLVGAVIGLLVHTRLRLPLLRSLTSHPVPTFLLLAMLGYRLVPYVPVIDLHKYWNALKPLLYGPFPDPAETFRYFAVWLTASELLAEICGPGLSLLMAPLLVGFVLLGKILIYSSVVTRPEVAGAAVVVLIAWPMLHRSPGRTATVALILLASLVIERLEPFEFAWGARPFGWLPFRSFFGGSLVVNSASLLEKLFLYGSLVWLWTRAGARLWMAALGVAAVLFATSLAETALPDRSAEITDALLALLVAGLISLLEPAAVSPRPGYGEGTPGRRAGSRP